MPRKPSTRVKRIIISESEDEDFVQNKMSKVTKKCPPAIIKVVKKGKDIRQDAFVVNDDSDSEQEISTKPLKNGRSKKDKTAIVKPRVRSKSMLTMEKVSKKTKSVDINKCSPVVKVEKRSLSGSYRPKWLGEARDPPQHGTKSIPVGKPGCLKGMIFVLSGLNESLTREEMSDLIKSYEGIERSAISGKTKYLVAGFEMEDGRPITEGSKYRAAMERGVEIIGEDQLLSMIRSSNPSAVKSERECMSQTKPVDVESEMIENEMKVMEKREKTESRQLLTVKYAPRSQREIIGNEKVVENLRLWLTGWCDVHINKTVQIEWNKQNPGSRAVLLSGIGKTTSALVLASELGYDVIELNASDKRSMSSIRDVLGDSVSMSSIRMHSTGKRIVLMDEVDGMSTGDRGGIKELIKIIKYSLTPIICICNDRDDPKIRSLATACYDLTFSRPSASLILNRLVYICEEEKLPMSLESLRSLVETTGCDIRQCLNKLQILNTSHSPSVIDSISTVLPSFAKDSSLDQTGFEVAKQLLVGTVTHSFLTRYNMFFNDYELTPLVVEQNYLDSIKSVKYDEFVVTDIMADAADAICDMETFHNAMVRTTNWKLLSFTGCMTVRAAEIAKGSYVYTKFPMFYGKYSKIKKFRRLLREFTNHMVTESTSTQSSVALEYFDVLNAHLLSPLENGDVDMCISRLDEYGLSRDDLVEFLNGTTLSDAKSRFEEIPSKQRSSFTRKYNSSLHAKSNIFADGDDLFKRIASRKSNKRVIIDAPVPKSKKITVKVEEIEMEEKSSDSEALYVN